MREGREEGGSERGKGGGRECEREGRREGGSVRVREGV